MKYKAGEWVECPIHGLPIEVGNKCMESGCAYIFKTAEKEVLDTYAKDKVRIDEAIAKQQKADAGASTGTGGKEFVTADEAKDQYGTSVTVWKIFAGEILDLCKKDKDDGTGHWVAATMGATVEECMAKYSALYNKCPAGEARTKFLDTSIRPKGLWDEDQVLPRLKYTIENGKVPAGWPAP